MNAQTPRAGMGVYVGLLLTTLTTLAYQLLLTRIFSVTMWYHYTFMSVSVTMFGMTVGAILVYLRPRWFAPAVAAERMGVAAACFAVLIVLSYLIHLQMRFTPGLDIEDLLTDLQPMVVNYVLLSLPFVASGVCVTIALTRFPQEIGRLYAVDLIGAGLGCLLVAVVSRWIDAPTLVLDVAALAMGGAMCCMAGTHARQWRWLGVGLLPIVLVLVWANMGAPIGRPAVFRPHWVKGKLEFEPVYERWNAFSRVAVWGAGLEPVGWGMSERFQPQEPVRQFWLNIDGSAGSVMTQFDGDPSRLEFLRYDVTNIVHYIRPQARVLVVGSGGGRDILSALYFEQPEIVGVEINETILETVNGRYGRLTGHLDRLPEVTFVNDDARSYIARTRKKFDVIQVSLIDTWAATAAGAYVLTENGLYTIETWERMLRRLTDRGVLTFSRWYSASGPGEIYRLTVLAVATLKRLGISDPADHLMIVYRHKELTEKGSPGLATLLASRRPFSPKDIDTIERVAEEMAFHVLLSPREASDATLARIASGKDFEAFLRDFPVDISPPTDDRPFFFDMIRLRDVLTLKGAGDAGMEGSSDAFITLGILLLMVVVLTGLCVVVPLTLSLGRQSLAGSLPHVIYFCSIGLAFMLVEIALMMRLSIFLGHPIYSMIVVLFCLLLASGCGSWLSGVIVKDPVRGLRGPACLAVLVGAVLLATLVAMPLLPWFDGQSIPIRVSITLAALLPLGLVMGMAFPLGMRVASRHPADLTAWLFGMNGATSICGSVLAVVISLCLGITAAMLAGVACYLGALLSFVWARRSSGVGA